MTDRSERFTLPLLAFALVALPFCLEGLGLTLTSATDVVVFAVAYFLPIEKPRTQTAFLEGLFLLKDYARQHVILCLVPALFIAGAIGHRQWQSGWRIVAAEINWEDKDLVCDHTGEPIECAYGND